MSDKLVIEHLFKILGPEPDQAMRLLERGRSKAEIFEQTRTTVGVQDATFSIREGEVFVVTGLSGFGKSTLVRTSPVVLEMLPAADQSGEIDSNPPPADR